VDDDTGDDDADEDDDDDDMIDIEEERLMRTQQLAALAAHRDLLVGLIGESQTLYQSVMSHISSLGRGSGSVTSGNDDGASTKSNYHQDGNESQFVEQNFHHVESMLRRSEEYTTISTLQGGGLLLNDMNDSSQKVGGTESLNNNNNNNNAGGITPKTNGMFRLRATPPTTMNEEDTSSQSSIRNREMYSDAFECCKLLTSPGRYGDGVRVVMYILSRLGVDNQHQQRRWQKQHQLQSGDAEPSSEDVTSVYLEAIDVLTTIIPKEAERALIFDTVWKRSNAHNKSNTNNNDDNNHYSRMRSINRSGKVDTKVLMAAMVKALPSFVAPSLSSDSTSGARIEDAAVTGRRWHYRGSSSNTNGGRGEGERMKRRRRYG